MKSDNGILVSNVSRAYGSTQALKKVSFNVGKGEIYGLIGPDGAGKSTLFRILTTLLLPDSGSAVVAGFNCVKDYREVRKRVGYMPGRFSLYQDLTVEENIIFFASVYKTTVEENYHLIKDIYSQIEPFKKRRAGKLSGGMKQKLALSCALVHKPEVLFLDEPTTGVDAVSRKEFWEMLHRLKDEGLSILVSTPYMDEAMMCDRVGFIQHGEIFSSGKPQYIIDNFRGNVYKLKTSNPQQSKLLLAQQLGSDNVHRFGSELHLFSDVNMDTTLQDFALQHQQHNISFELATPTIEDCFIQLMKNNHE